MSSEFFDVLGFELLRGRAFTAAQQSVDAGVAGVSGRTAHQLWPDADAVGKVLRLDSDQPFAPRRPSPPPSAPPASRAYTVIGVLRDVGKNFDWSDFHAADVYLPTSPQAPGTSLVLRVNGDSERARRTLIERLTPTDPALGEIWTMRSLARMRAYILAMAFAVTVALGVLALALTLSGLYSVLSYLVAQRTREIAVRIALGATPRAVATLVLSQLLRPVAAGLVLGAALAAVLATALMSTAVGAPIGTAFRVFDFAAYAGSTAIVLACCLLAASLPALRAARLLPLAALKKD